MAKQRSRTLTRVKGIESPDFEKSDHLSVLHETEMGLWDFGRETAGQQVDAHGMTVWFSDQG